MTTKPREGTCGDKVPKEAGMINGIGISRRGFLKGAVAGLSIAVLNPFSPAKGTAGIINPLFWIKNIPDQPFYGGGEGNYHVGMDYLLYLMGDQGLKIYRSVQEGPLSGPSGMIEANDVVLIKVNAQWKYRGSTNSDLIRGLIQRILDHPDGFNGEVVIIENGQSQGSLNGDALGWGSYPDHTIHANANDESHSFHYLVDTMFNDPRVSSYLLDPIRTTLIGANDHATQGYRTYENVSYPCFTTDGGRRVELMEGIWQGNGYNQNLKLINVPVLKVHGGSEITASLKHFYGVLSMADGVDSGRHYTHLGDTCGKMVVSVRTPILNIIDAIWVSHESLSGYPASATFRANQILASQDPVALDYWAAKYILYPKTLLPNHLPTFSGIDQWLTGARDIINSRGGLSDLNSGIFIESVTKNEREMQINEAIPAPLSMGVSIIAIDSDTTAIKYGSWYPPGFYGFTALGGSSTEVPAMAVFTGREYMAVKGAMTNKIFLRYQDSTGTWTSWGILSGGTSKSPALAGFNNRLYMVVKGAATYNIWLRSMDGSGDWDSSWALISGETAEAPALAVFNNRLYLFVKGVATDAISYRSMDPSGVWDGWSILSGGATNKPIALAAFNNRLYLFVKGAATNDIFYQSMDASETWSSGMRLSGQTTEAPSVTVLGDRLYVAVKGAATDNAFIRSMDLMGNWDPSWILVPANTNKTPVLSAF